MLRFDFFCSLAAFAALAACNADSTTASPAGREVRYSGTVSQPAAGGFLVYKMSGVWKLDDKGALISGADSVTILDGTVYGMTGTVSIVSKTKCIAIVGKDAWAESEVVSVSDPRVGAPGSFGVERLSVVGGVAKGGGGPKDAWYPNGNTCVDKPAAMPAFEMKGGTIIIP